ncbi:MAG: hypothetical protein IT347_12550 [Candidatus Eisenbacteria bacterium]|nr:hypothetical protein [Candidatus Eisenbacteria bacterium]
MGARFWLVRFLVATFVAAALLFVVRLLRGNVAADAAKFAAAWGVASGGLFTLTGYVRHRRNPACMLPPPGQRQGP